MVESENLEKVFGQDPFPPSFPSCLLTFMLLVGWIMYPDWDQDEEDEKGPDDLNQQLDLKKEDIKMMTDVN